MTEPHVIPAEVSRKPESAHQKMSSPSVLITEQEVAFSTAAAQGVRPETSHRWVRATRIIAVVSRRLFPTPTADSPKAHRHYPRHYSFIEDALMAREMHRL